MEYLWAWWTLIHEKNLSSKISCQTPFNQRRHVREKCVSDQLATGGMTAMITDPGRER
jgi:hypothetical protein